MQTVKRLPLWFFVGLVTIFYFLFFCRYTLLTASDLGRHITNGQVILETGKIFSTNLYSYTTPEYHAPNHHWLFGVIVYGLYHSLGFAGITIVTAALYASSAGIIFWYIGRKYGRIAMIIAATLIIPLMAERAEVRPEAFSIFFFALEIVLLLLWNQKKISTLYLTIAFFCIAVLWVNIHIFFFITVIVLGSFGLQALVEKNWQNVWQLCVVGLIGLVGTLCNPLFIEGAIYPTKILQEYGYEIAENQTPYFFLQYYTTRFHWYLVGMFIGTLITGGFVIKKYGFKYTAILVLFLIFLIFTNKLIRFANFYALTAALIVGICIQALQPFIAQVTEKIKKNTVLLSVTSFLSFGVVATMLGSGMFFPLRPGFGLGLVPKINNSAEFFKQLQVTGPIFNNFDIGGYLIYHLYPEYRVYVDNRAEAYPASFLEEYKAAQLDPTVWQKIDAQYQFGAIYFNRLERTDWSQQFLITTFQNEQWIPIYVDQYTIIFIRNIPAHQEIIEKYRLPDEIFTISTG